MKRLLLIVGLLLASEVALVSPLKSQGILNGCRGTAKCPVDDATSVLVDTNVANGHVVGTYEHGFGGSKHRFVTRCN